MPDTERRRDQRDDDATPAVTTFGAAGEGGRLSSFAWRGLQVTVRDVSEQTTERAFEHASRLARAPRDLREMRATIERLRDELLVERAKVRVSEAAPARLLGVGCVRFRGPGLWLLNRQAEGWAAFGIRLDGWDELFRRFNVRVVDHGTDECGPWWAVDNCKPSP